MKYFRNPRFASIALSAALVLSLVAGPAAAQASSLSSAQVNAVIALLQAFGVSSDTIASVQAVLENQPAPVSSSGTSSDESGSGSNQSSGTGTSTCAVISDTLRVGSTDQETEGEVSRLQSFLSKDTAAYPEGSVTGYFGSSTEIAVRHWQASHHIVSSGDAQSTGYGQVGPMTRGEMDKEIETECEQGDANSSAGTGNTERGGEHSDTTATSSASRSGGDN